MPNETDVESVLWAWVRGQGPGLLDDPRRVRAILCDAVPYAFPQIDVLVAALEDGVPTRLRSAPPGRQAEEGQRVVADLIGRRAMPRPFAEWAVGLVAHVLGLPWQPDDGRSGRTSAARRRAWIWTAAAVAVLLIGGGVTAFLLLRAPDPSDVVRELEERRALAYERQDVDLLRDYYADEDEAVAEAEGFTDDAQVVVRHIEIESAADERIVARVTTLESEPPEEVEVELTYEVVSVGGGDEDWRVTQYGVVDD